MAFILNAFKRALSTSNTPNIDRPERETWGGNIIQTSTTRPVALMPTTALEKLLWGTRDQYENSVLAVDLDPMYKNLNTVRTNVVKMGTDNKHRNGTTYSVYSGKILQDAGRHIRDPKRISSGSNGVAMRARLHEMIDSLNSKNVVVKFPRISIETDENPIISDAMDFEFINGLRVNKLRKHVPNFVYTIGFFIINACVARNYDEPVVFSFGEADARICANKGQVNGYNNVISKAVPMLVLESVESETPWRYDPSQKHDTNAISLVKLLMGWDMYVPSYLKPIRSLLIMSHLCQLLLALQTGYDDISFTHNDLNMNNVLVTPVAVDEQGLPELVWFNYTMTPFDDDKSSKSTTYRLPTLFRLTIIDFSRAHTGIDQIAVQDIGKKYGINIDEKNYDELTQDWPYGVDPSKANPIFDMVVGLRLAFAAMPKEYIDDERMKTVIVKVGTCDLNADIPPGEYGCHPNTIAELKRRKRDKNIKKEELDVIPYPGPKPKKLDQYPYRSSESMAQFIMDAYGSFNEAYAYTHKNAPEFNWGVSSERGQVYGASEIRSKLSKLHSKVTPNPVYDNLVQFINQQSTTLIPASDTMHTVLERYCGPVNNTNKGCHVNGCYFPVHSNGLCRGHVVFANTVLEGRKRYTKQYVQHNTA